MVFGVNFGWGNGGKMFNGMTNKLDNMLDATVFLSYNRIGYALRQTVWLDDDLAVDLNGKVYVVTGANAGLGYATCHALAERGATVYMVVRDFERGQVAQAELIIETGNPNIHLEVADMSHLSKVHQLAERLKNRTHRIDALIHNAGVLLDSWQLSPEGHEMTLATNVLGPFLLTQQLIPLLHQSAPSRIIFVSSGGMYGSKLDVSNLQANPNSFNGIKTYAHTKRIQVILTEMLADNLKNLGITVNSMHPGWAKTPGLKKSLSIFSNLMSVTLRDPIQGSDTIVWLAIAPHLVNETGQFWFDRKSRSTHKLAHTQSSADEYQQLWAKCIRLCGLIEGELSYA